MKRALCFTFVIWNLVLGFSAAEDKPLPAIAWYSDIGQAFADAREKKLPLLLFVELPDQTYSRQLLDKFADPEISTLLKDVVPVRVDVRKESQLMDQLVTRVIPDLRVFDPEGRQTLHASGSIDAAALKKFLTDAKTAKPEAGAPSLSMLFPSNDLEGILKLESESKIPEGQTVTRLVELAGGQSGETRVEAQRLLKLWAPRLAPQLSSFLSSKTLKPRLVAFEALGDLEAPLESYDPWSGPAAPELIARLQKWGEPIAANAASTGTKKSSAFPALPKRTLTQVESDLKDLRSGDKARQDAAWQRLISVGRGLVPVLREQARALVVNDPATALRYDELRFRLLLGAETLRRRPAAPRKLAVGNPGERASLLTEILQSGVADLEGLAREAACDRDPLVRETAIRNATAVMDNSADLLRETLKDGDANVRVAALTVMAQSASHDNADAIAKYLASEPDADMIGHAVRALASVDNQSSRGALRGLLKDARWPVRAAAVEALGKMHDTASLPEIEALISGDDGFVAGQAITALKDLNPDNLKVETLLSAVKKHPAVTLTVIKVLGSSKLRKAKEADNLLRVFTRNPNPEIRAQALESLASDQERPAFEEVAAAMSDTAAVVRTAAVRSMRALIDSSSVKSLREGGKPPPDGYKEVRAKITGMLKEADEELRMQAILTLCYFGDSELCWKEFLAALSHPREHSRTEAYGALRSLPPPKIMQAIRYCLDDKQVHRAPEEWSSLLGYLRDTFEDKAAAWAVDEPRAQAFFEILPRLDAEELDTFMSCLKYAALNDSRDMNSAADTANRKALAALFERWSGALPNGLHKQALRLAWIEAADLDDAKLRTYMKDEDFEVRRMAMVVAIRAKPKGPDELVKQFLADPKPEIRRLAVAAAIPTAWRDKIDDPISYDVIAGQKVDSNRSSRSIDLTKAPKVVELPVETLEQLLKDDDEEVRYLAAYLMALEGGDQGIPILLRRMRAVKKPENSALVLLRALILAWSDEFTPQLEEAALVILRSRYTWMMREVWPQVKLLKGAEIKKLRARLAKDFPELK